MESTALFGGFVEKKFKAKLYVKVNMGELKSSHNERFYEAKIKMLFFADFRDVSVNLWIPGLVFGKTRTFSLLFILSDNDGQKDVQEPSWT